MKRLDSAAGPGFFSFCLKSLHLASRSVRWLHQHVMRRVLPWLRVGCMRVLASNAYGLGLLTMAQYMLFQF